MNERERKTEKRKKKEKNEKDTEREIVKKECCTRRGNNRYSQMTKKDLGSIVRV